MLESPAIVVGLEGGTALVESDYGGGCGSGMCSKGGCGTAVLGQLFSKRPRGPMQVSNPIQARPGERVIIGVEEGALVQSAILAYLLPLLIMIASVLVAHSHYPGRDDVSAVAALAGLVAGWGLSRLLARRWFKLSKPAILRRA